MKMLLCLAGLLLTTAGALAQTRQVDAKESAAVHAVTIDGVVQCVDLELGTVCLQRGETLVKCLIDAESIAGDEAGRRVAWDRIQPGAQVSAQCLCEADHMKIESLFLQKARAPSWVPLMENSDTSVSGVDFGVCREVNAHWLMVAGSHETSGRIYLLGKATQCVDESGMPVSLAKVGEGTSIAVHFVEHAGRTRAARIVVGKTVSRDLAAK
jgi:hypothetical protein